MSEYTRREPDGSSKVYPGISPLLEPKQLEGRFLCLAWFDGEPDLWVIDSAEAIKEVVRTYTDDGFTADRVHIQVFNKA